MNESVVRQAFLDQARWCDGLGSPFTACLMRVIESLLDRECEVGRRILEWQGNPSASHDSVPLRLAGALQALALGGHAPALAALYPPNAMPSQGALTALLPTIFREHETFLLELLRFAPQTNEAGRSAILYPAMAEIARVTGKPLALFELGSSAGLNLALDMFAYRFGGNQVGKLQSSLSLAPEWSGEPLEPPPFRVASRRGCDLNPLDIRVPMERARLRSYVWADQSERIARFEAAASIAADLPIRLDKAEAANWVEQNLELDHSGQTCPVLFHTIAAQYFPEESRARIAAHLEKIGAAATPDRPLAWLAFEQVPGEGHLLTLRLWPGGEARMLAKADPHGRKVEWRG